MPSRLSWGIGRAATLLKTLLQYFGKSLEALLGVAYPGFRDNRSTLNTKTGYKKKLMLLELFSQIFICCIMLIAFAVGLLCCVLYACI